MQLIVETLWQGCGLALVAWCLLLVLRWSRASVRYAVLWASIAAAVALPLMRRIPGNEPAAGVAAGQAIFPLQLTLPAAGDIRVKVAATLWLLVAMLLVLRLALGIVAARRMRARCAPAPASVLRRLGVPIGRRGFAGELLLCDEVRIPAVLGLFRPAIVMSRRLVESLSDDELDQVLLHEWAHIRRRDQWAKLAQGAVRCLWFFHPGIWWLSRSLDLEREIACDEWVTSRTRAPRLYASALTSVAQSLVGPQRLGTAPQTATSRREITLRVERLLRSEGRPPLAIGWSWVAAGVLFAAGAAAVHHSMPAFTRDGAGEALVLSGTSPIITPAAELVGPAAEKPLPRRAPQQARAQSRAQLPPAADDTPAAPQADPGETARTEIAGAAAGELPGPRSMELNELLIDASSPPSLASGQKRVGLIDVSGFHSLAGSLARSGKGAGGFFQRLAVSTRDSF